MSTEITRRFGRPSWMTPFGHEGFGDVFFDRLWPEWRRDLGEEWSPRVDFFEKDGKYHITAEIPGMKKEDISVSIENGYLIISGIRESTKEDNNSVFYLKESRKGSFTRRFRLPDDVDEEKVDASYENGVLTLLLLRKDGSKTKKIAIH